MPRQLNDKTFRNPPLTEQDESGDVIFRFRLTEPSIPSHPEQALEFFFRGQIQDLLRVVGLTHKGQRLFVDGFHFLNDPETLFPLWPDPSETEKAEVTKDAGGPTD